MDEVAAPDHAAHALSDTLLAFPHPFQELLIHTRERKIRKEGRRGKDEEGEKEGRKAREREKKIKERKGKRRGGDKERDRPCKLGFRV